MYVELDTVERITSDILSRLPTAKFSFEALGIDVL